MLILLPVARVEAALQPYQATTWDADIHLPVARYRAFKPVATKGNFAVTIDPGTYLDGITIGSPAAGQQRWIGKGVALKNCRISGDLGLKLQLADSVIENSAFLKGGGWFVDFWSSQWRFQNCLITKNWFVQPLSVTDFSVVATNCTIVDVKLPPISLKKACDYFQGDSMRMENCEFIRCTVPLTFLAATVNCVFVDCHFPVENVPWPPQMPPVKVNAYFSGLGTPPPSFENGPVSVTWSEKPKDLQAGSSLEYHENGGDVAAVIPPPTTDAQIGNLSGKKASELGKP